MCYCVASVKSATPLIYGRAFVFVSVPTNLTSPLARAHFQLPQRLRHQVDLETKENPSPLPTEAFGAALVFRYLHRPLMPNLRNSIKPGGLVLYETYTWEHPYLGGRPRNPAFLLGSCELKEMFPGWEVLHFFEGTEGRTRAVSRIVCRKPAASILPASSSCSPSS